MSDPSDSQVRLPRAAEDLLEGWPVPEKDEQFWNEAAETVMTRVEMARAGSTDDALLAAPLPSEIGEGTRAGRTPSMPVSKPTPPPPSAAPISLAALARAVASETAQSDNADIARESLSLAARARTSAPSIPDAPVSGAPALAVAQPPPSLPEPPVSAVPAPPVDLLAARSQRAPKRSIFAPVVAIGVVLAGVAAAAVIVVQHQQQAGAPVALATPTPPNAAPAEPSPPGAVAEGKADLELATPEALPTEVAANTPAPVTGPVVQAPRPAAKTGAAPAAAEQPTAPEEIAKTEPAKTAAPPEDKEAAKMKPAAQPTDVPQEPSLGAAQAAIGSVIGSARACVAGHEAPSNARVVFGSDGRVQSVAVSGPAAGTPAEACIRAAMSRARVAPFAKPTFSVGTPVRP